MSFFGGDVRRWQCYAMLIIIKADKGGLVIKN